MSSADANATAGERDISEQKEIFSRWHIRSRMLYLFWSMHVLGRTELVLSRAESATRSSVEANRGLDVRRGPSHGSQLIQRTKL